MAATNRNNRGTGRSARRPANKPIARTSGRDTNKRRKSDRPTIVDLLLSQDSKKYFIAIASVCAVTTIAAIIFVAVHLSTRINGTEVFIDGTSLGSLKGTSYSAVDIQEKALTKLKSDKGIVNVNETVTTKPVHAKKFVDESYIIGEIYNKFTFTVQAAVITVNDVDRVILKTVEDAESVRDEIKNTYYLEGASSIDFVEKVEIVERFVDESEILADKGETKAVDKAKDILTAAQNEEVTYLAKSGDTLLGIAASNGMSYPSICNFNPIISQDPSKLKVGDEVIIQVKVPLVSVVTIRHETYEEKNETGQTGIAKDEVTRTNGVETYRKRTGWEIIAE